MTELDNMVRSRTSLLVSRKGTDSKGHFEAGGWVLTLILGSPGRLKPAVVVKFTVGISVSQPVLGHEVLRLDQGRLLLLCLDFWRLIPTLIGRVRAWDESLF